MQGGFAADILDDAAAARARIKDLVSRRRAASATRPVPIPSQFVRMPRAHAQANRRIEQSMNEWQRVSQGDVPEG